MRTPKTRTGWTWPVWRAWLTLILGAVAPPVLAAEAPASSRPNILLILADDLGFSDLGCYGGEIATPHLDRLAANGLRFTQFYNTARCWPTRGALLTGYYPQQIRMDPPRGRFPAWTRTLPQHLKPLGYRCYHSGKWHINGAPRSLADGGFDHSYQLEDHDRNFNPNHLIEDDQKAAPVPPGTGYYTATAFANHTIRCLQEHEERYPAQPFFAFLAFTTPHFPLQAPAEDIAKYRDRYLAGWEVIRAERYARQQALGIVTCQLSAPEPQIRAPSGKPDVEKQLGPGEVAYALRWDELTAEQQRFQATKMAIHAAMVDRLDQEVGRVLAQVKAMGAWDNTLVLFLSDNGASAEILVRGDGHDPSAAPGSAGSYLCLGPGWSTVCNTPFRRHKIWVHEGGVSTPLILHWPAGVAAKDALRHDIGHVVDVVPTLLEAAGAKTSRTSPSAPPFPGRSLVPAFARDGAAARGYVFFQHAGNRALRVGDWKGVSSSEATNTWSLYDLASDRAESRDLASSQPQRTRELAVRWQELEDEFRQQAAEAPATAVNPTANPPKPSRRPNVVLIMADDLGYETIGANGGTSYRTPVLDRLAATGVRFEHCYVQPLCTPTRVQLMTGAYNVRNYTKFGEMNPELATFGNLFHSAGYATAIAGKWQLGRDPALPRRFGFDESYLWQHTRRPPRYANPGLEINGLERDYANGEYGPDLINAQALDFISRHRDQPFLLYYPMILTHAPYQPTPDSPTWEPQARGEQVNRRPEHFADMVTYMDKLVGQVVARLEALGLREDTLLIFLGDNGTGAGVRSRMGDRLVMGGKGQTTRAGMHVPLIVNWPGHVVSGGVCRDLVDSTDFLPTICDAAGIVLPAGFVTDGRSFLPQLRGQQGNPREWVYSWYSPRGEPVKECAFDQHYKLYRDGRFYDLREDPDETHPRSLAELPAEAASAAHRLEAALARFQR